jgi:hypothetical protein
MVHLLDVVKKFINLKTNKMQQTVVEWLEEQIKDIFYIAEASEMTKKFKSVYDRAKEMEKEQKGYSEEDMKDYALKCVFTYLYNKDVFNSDFLSIVTNNNKQFEQFKKKIIWKY